MEQTFGQRLRNLREQSKFTLREAAQKIGLTSGYLSLLEHEKQVGLPSEETIRKIADLYSINADELILLAGKLPSDEYEAVKAARKNGLGKEEFFQLLRIAR